MVIGQTLSTLPLVILKFTQYLLELCKYRIYCNFSGVPYFTHQSNATMFETDDKYRLLGFRIEDLGCCKVICHKDFGRKVFVGTMFTTMSNQGSIQDIFRDLNISHLIAFQSKKQDKPTVTETKFF